MTSAATHLARLCQGRDRRPGSAENLAATRYVAATFRDVGWDVDEQWFDCLDWESSGGEVEVAGTVVAVTPSPYGTGVVGSGRLVGASTPDELSPGRAEGCVLVLHGALTSRPLTPRGYPFYSDEADARVLDLVEGARPLAAVAVTGRHPELCGAMDPFPLVEDGSFGVPVADVDPAGGAVLLEHLGEPARVDLRARRRPAHAANVVARRGPAAPRVTAVAHVDTKPGTPGALDNGTGVAALLRVAEMLPERGRVGVELLVVNGEDYYAASGELRYLQTADLDEVALAVNVDGVGLPPTAWSAYGCPPEVESRVRASLGARGLVEGPAWFQSDHAVFAMRGRPAVALTSADLQTALGSVAHAPTDTVDGVDVGTVEQAAEAVVAVVEAVG